MVATVTASTRPMRKPMTYPAIGLLLAIVVVAAGNYNIPKGENGGTGPAIFTAILCIALTAVMFGLVVPRVGRIERTTLFLGILSLVSLVVFWSGITPVLASATFAATARGVDLGKRAAVGQALAVGAGLLAVGGTLAQSHLF